MRNTAIIALKLLGILCIYWAAASFVEIGLAITTPLFSRGLPFSISVAWVFLAVWLFLAVIPVFLAWMLLFRTDWIIARLKLPVEASPACIMEPSQLLRVGLVVLGAFTIIQALPEMGRTLYMLGQSLSPHFPASSSQNYRGSCISAALKFLLGCIVIGRSERFARTVFPASREEGS